MSDTVGMSFTPHPEADQRRRSSKALIKMLLADRTPEALPEHVRKLIDTMLWKLTEADGKHNTRHRSDGAMPHSDPKLLHHEHVFPKKKMIDDLQRASSSDEIDRILATAVGCVVTPDEHTRLRQYDHEVGWQRYRGAGIGVVNCETGERVA